MKRKLFQGCCMYNSSAGLRFVELLFLDFQSQFGGGKKKRSYKTQSVFSQWQLAPSGATQCCRIKCYAKKLIVC